MLVCVCRPVTGTLPRSPPSAIPPAKRINNVVTCEPRISSTTTISTTQIFQATKVPGRPTAAELRAMALRQQQQIDSQHQLLAAKEQRLRFLKTQDARGAAAAAEGERLRRLRERVEAQESKLRRLRALRGQVDLQKTYNVTLSNDLDSIRALFSEKEKELSLAVAKVEALTRQLEELRRDRRGPYNLIQANGLAGNNGGPGGNGTAGNNQQLAVSPAARELEKLRRELMYRNQLSLQQDARLHIQREALQQRQAELRSVDQRILELQTRLQKKKASNLLISQTSNNNNNNNNNNAFLNSNPNSNNNQATINLSISNLTTNANTILQQQNSNNLNNIINNNSNNVVSSNNNNNSSSTQPSQLPKLQTGNLNGQLRKSTNIYPQQRIIPRGNVAAIEPFNHSPQKIQAPTVNNSTNAANNNVLKPAHQLIQDLANSKLNQLQYQPHQQQQQVNAATIQQNHHQQSLPESDENKLARKLQKIGGGSKEILDDDANLIEKLSDGKFQTLPYNTKFNSNNISNNSNSSSTQSNKEKINECDSEKAGEIGNGQTVHSTPLVAVNKSIAIVPQTAPTPTTTDEQNGGGGHIIKPALKSKMFMKQPQPPHQHHQQQLHHQIPSGNAVVPPRKPISSVAPTIAPKINPKIHVVQPISTSTSNNNISSSSSSNSNSNNSSNINSNHHNDLDSDKQTVPVSPRPALPPKPNKAQNNQNNSNNNNSNTNHNNINNNNSNNNSENSNSENVPTIVNLITKSQSIVMEAQHVAALNDPNNINQLASIAIQDNLPIKARPLTIKKQPFHEQPKLKNFTSGIKPIQYTSRRIEMPPSFLFPEIERVELKDRNNDSNQSSIDETDKANIVNNDTISTTSSSSSSIPSIKEETGNGGSGLVSVLNGVIKRRQNNGDMTKIKLSRRVSFDPLALLLDASLEGELELVKKTAMQVANPSAANDEGITALHNAICAGHLEIVKFLVEFGCDVNAQDSDGWTPLHCAASCNNLTMVKFLVESGACLFAATLSDHETPAEKCEEDEEGFDGCSEYLYSIQEKLGILNNGEVYAVFAYDAQQSDELSFTVNDCLTILRKGDDSEREWWWARNADNKEGYVPRNLFGLYPRVPLSNQTE